MPSPYKPRVFITYTDIDKHGKELGAKLKKELEASGYDVFFFDHSAKRSIGRPLWSVLAGEIDNRDAILVVCTEGILASYGAEFEYNHALQREKLVVPMIYDEAPVPSPLASRVRDPPFDDQTYAREFKTVAETLPSAYRSHLKDQEQRRKLKAKLQAQPKTEPKEVLPSPRAVMLLRSITTAYYSSSLIQEISTVENYNPSIHGDLGFTQIGVRVPVLSANIEAKNRVYLVDELGRSIALGERNYLRDVWEKTREHRYPSERFTAEGFQDVLDELSKGINPKVLLAPIEKFVEITSWMLRNPRGIRLTSSLRKYFSLRDGRDLRIVWSNKYSPLDRFLLVDPAATRWLVKPDEFTGGRLTAKLVENARDRDKVDFYVRTIVNAELANVDGVRPFRFGEAA